MNVVEGGRRGGNSSTKYWNEAIWNKGRWKKSRKPLAPIPGPVKVVVDDDRTPRIVNLMETTEALQIRKKKEYEEDRSSNSNGHRVRVPRCPLTGAGRKVRRLRTVDDVSPRLFTISNFLTPQDCESYVTSAEASQKFRYQTKNWYLGWEGGEFLAQREGPLHWDQKSWKAQKAQAERFNRTNAYHQDVWVEWSSKLKAAFEGLSLEGHDRMRAFSVGPVPEMHRYEKGEKCEPHNVRHRPPHTFYCARAMIPSLDGYCVLVYLNGGQAGDNSSDPSPSVVGGETVFYSQNYLNGNSMKRHIAKVAPETGLAVCLAVGHRNTMTEIRPVTKGVMYMLEFRIQFA